MGRKKNTETTNAKQIQIESVPFPIDNQEEVQAQSIIQETEKKITSMKQLAIDKMRRDSNGLFEHILYVFNDDGTVNWKAMIPDQYIEINKTYFERKKLETPKSKDGLSDAELLVRLGGIKEVAKIRGIKSVTKRVVESSDRRAVVICGIEFIPNYETNFLPFYYEEVANATIANTNDFGKLFLETTASNRAFVRAVRNALRIDIAGYEELIQNTHEPDNAEQGNTDIWSALESAAANIKSDSIPNGLATIEEFKSFVTEKQVVSKEEAETWKKWKDIPAGKVLTFMGQINKL